MADTSGKTIIKYFGQKLKSFFLSKDILSFLLFLGLSAAFWFVHALGKERETVLTIPIKYVGIPVNVVITNSPPNEIQISIKDQGLKLFDYSKSQFEPLIIDLTRTFYQKGKIVISADQINTRIKRHLNIHPTTTLLEVHPDSFLIHYQKLGSKTLPVKFVSRIVLTNQYMLSEKIKIEPEKVTVFGLKQMLDTLKYASTELISLNDLNDTVILKCQLKQSKNIRYSTEKIKVSIFVEPFTERKVQLAVTAVNCPSNLFVRAFPAYVNVVYTVGLSQFKTLNTNDIQIQLDYNDLKNNKLSKQRLTVKNNSTHISNIRIMPQEVEFVLEQK